jgi:Holliday junction resolvasome RuvABC endonuclease subunit
VNVQGWDVSPNHSAVVELDAKGDLVWFSFAAQTPKAVKMHREAVLLEEIKQDGFRHSAMRIKAYPAIFSRWLERPCVVVGIEDYAYSQPHKAHAIGEVGGLIRQACLATSRPYLLWSPGAIKKFATGNGNADKKQMMECVESRWGFCRKDLGAVVWPDLADAFACAKLTHAIMRVHQGDDRNLYLDPRFEPSGKVNKKILEVLKTCSYDPIT